MRTRTYLAQVGTIWLAVLLVACRQEEPQGKEYAAPVAPEAMSHDLGPFFQAETAMYDNMRAAVGTSSDDSWARMMIAHHRGGAAISRVVLEEDPPPRIADLAGRTVQAQEKAVRDLEELLREGAPDVEGALNFLEPMRDMHETMMAVEGSNACVVWLHKMIEHHRGAIEMSDVLLQQPGISEDTVRAVRALQNGQRTDMQALEQALADLKPLQGCGS